LLAIFATSTSLLAETSPLRTASSDAGRWVFADIDGDQKSDLAELRQSFLELRLGSGLRQYLPIVSGDESPAMGISVVDIDGDSDLDIVVQDRLDPLAYRHTHVWLNSGKGSFIEASRFHIPLPTEQRSWNLTSPSIMETLAPTKTRHSIYGLAATCLDRPIASDFIAAENPELEGARLCNGTARLRAPPHSYF